MLNTKRNEVFNANDVINSNDLRKRIANVDSRFRKNIIGTTTDFYYKFETSYKNVIRARIASVEIPNMYYNFSEANYKNTFFTISANDYNNVTRTVKILIPDGNYTAIELLAAIQTDINNKLLYPYGIYINIYPNIAQIKTEIEILGVIKIPSGPSPPAPVWPPTTLNWQTIQSQYTTKAPSQFTINFYVPELKNRLYNNGLGFNLGFRAPHYLVNTPGSISGSYGIKSESCIDVIGDMYCFLCIDDFNTVTQQTNDNTFECLAKIIIREDKGNVIYDDGSTLLSNDVIFPSPVDIKQLRVRLLNPLGNPIDLLDMNFSFSLELTEVMNTKLYEFYRNYIWLGQLPSLPQDVRGSGVPLLGGRGP